MEGAGWPGTKVSTTLCGCPFPMTLEAWIPEVVVIVAVTEIVVLHVCPGTSGTIWT
jgi:hypothetical protein